MCAEENVSKCEKIVEAYKRYDLGMSLSSPYRNVLFSVSYN